MFHQQLSKYAAPGSPVGATNATVASTARCAYDTYYSLAFCNEAQEPEGVSEKGKDLT